MRALQVNRLRDLAEGLKLVQRFSGYLQQNCDENRTCARSFSHFEWQIMRMCRFSSLFFVAKILKTAVLSQLRLAPPNGILFV